MPQVPELQQGRLLELVEQLLREHQAAMKVGRAAAAACPPACQQLLAALHAGATQEPKQQLHHGKPSRCVCLLFSLPPACLSACPAQVERPRVLEWDESKDGLISGFSYAFNNGWVPGTLGTSLANSSNAVMRT